MSQPCEKYHPGRSSNYAISFGLRHLGTGSYTAPCGSMTPSGSVKVLKKGTVLTGVLALLILSNPGKAKNVF